MLSMHFSFRKALTLAVALAALAVASGCVYRPNISQGNIVEEEDLDQVEELTEPVLAELKRDTAIGAFALLGAESVGPAVGRDLQEKARLAVVFSIIGMLVYIWVRFQHVGYGLAAVVALIPPISSAIFVCLNMSR